MDNTGASAAGIWSAPVNVDTVSEAGRHVAIEATPEVRAAAAKFAAVREIPSFSAEFDLTRRGAGLHVTGRVRARVGQNCVVSLEPLDNEVDEAVDLLFTPAAAGGSPGERTIEINSLEEADAAPEPLVGGRVDLGALAVEFLVLGIDPYPRKPDAAFSAPKVDDAADKPFAALAALKERSGDKGS